MIAPVLTVGMWGIILV